MRITTISVGVFIAVCAVMPESGPRARELAGFSPKLLSGTLGFKKQIIATGIDETHVVITADLDNDGDLDAVTTDYVDGQVLWLENDGTQSFTTHIVDPALLGAYPAAVADLDGDLDTDILAAGYLAGAFVWYENQGGGVFVRHDIDTNAPGAHSLVAWDPDEDGDLDLLTTSQDEGSVDWYENDGNEVFTRHVIDAAMPRAKRAEVADFDLDGDLDLVACSFDADEVAWYENSGSETFTKHSISVLADGSYYAVPADLDNDGDLDIAGVSRLDNSVSWYRNDGAGNFAAFDIATDAMGARMVQTGDVDSDGDLDVLATSVDDNTVGWYENDGAGNFSAHEVDVVALGAYGLWTADLDGNGTLDVFSGSRDAAEVAWHQQIREHREVLNASGASLVFGPSTLQATDADNVPAELTYTVTTAPTAGELRVSGTVLGSGGTFTQADVDASDLVYTHDGSALDSDWFSFAVADGSGGSPVVGTFRIFIGDGLVSHWPLNETSGLIAADLVGSNIGTLVAGPIWQAGSGQIGGALSFDGVDDRVDIGSFEIGGGDGLTLMMWVRPAALISAKRLISKAIGTSEQDHYWMISTFNASQLRFRLKTDGVTSTLITSSPVLAVDQWVHVACTYDGLGMRIYGDGELLASLPKSGALDGVPLVAAALGNQPAGAGNEAYAGLLDDVRIYSRALVASEITALMTGDNVSAAERGEPDMARAGAIRLLGNTPNPFNPMTTIDFAVHRDSRVTLDVFTVRGERVRRLVEGHRTVGIHRVMWDGRDQAGRAVASGIYSYRLQSDSDAEVRQMTLVR